MRACPSQSELDSNTILYLSPRNVQRISMRGTDPQPGHRYPRVVAASWGKGDPQKDAITLVYLDENGILRDNLKVDNLFDEDNKDTVKDLIKIRNPSVIVISGLSIHTTKLVSKFKELFKPDGIPIIYGYDDVARLYQHSKRADEEFSALSPIAKYCVGLARFTQSPLNEYAALGEDICALSLDDEAQNLVSFLLDFQCDTYTL
jgi:transcription elongation factor SPT6